MLTGMCAEDSRLGVDTCEFGREPGWRTFETMEAIQKKYPEAELYFVAGSDKLRIIPRWHRSKEFLQSFKLLATGARKLVEGNTWKNVFWGVDLRTGEGENHLGQILMQVREELKGNGKENE